MKLNKIHFYSGLILTLFIGVHLMNHLASIFGAEVHIEVMNKLRIIYRNPFIELLLMAAVLIQIFSGLKLLFVLKKIKKGFYKKLQFWTGLYLAFFLLIHVGVVLIGRFFLDMDTNIYFGAAGLNTFPFNIFFIPYYGLAIMSFFGHISAIHFQKMKKSLFGISVSRQSNLILVVGLILTVSIFYGLTNGFTGMDIPSEFDQLIGK